MPATHTFPAVCATALALATSAIVVAPAHAERTDRAQLVTYAQGSSLYDGDSAENPIDVTGDTYVRAAFRIRDAKASTVTLVLTTLGGPSASGFSCGLRSDPKIHEGKTTFDNVSPDDAIVCSASVQLPRDQKYWGLVTATFESAGSRGNVADQIHLRSMSNPTGDKSKFGEVPSRIEDVWALEDQEHKAISTQGSGLRWPTSTARPLAATGVRG